MTRAHHFTRKQRAELALRAKGCCELCGARLKVGEGEADHILPVELGGESTLANGQLLCKPCHNGKTATDVQRMRKAERQRDRHTGAIRPKGTMQSAGFPPRQKQQNAASSPLRKQAAWRGNFGEQPMTDHDELRRLALAAKAVSPAPWKPVSNRDGSLNVVSLPDDEGFSSKVCLVNGRCNHNAAHIAAANPSRILSLLDEIAALQERAERAEMMIFRLCESADAVLLGAAIHNDRGGTPRIEGPIVTILADRSRAARTFLTEPKP